MDVVLPMPAFPLAADPDSLLPAVGRWSSVASASTVGCGFCSAASVVSAGCD